MTKQTSNTLTANLDVPVSTTFSVPVQLAAAVLLGTVMLYGVGFVQTSAAHNAAHDVRHTLAFPCH